MGSNCYAIEGVWQANDKSKTKITINEVSTLIPGVNQYSLLIKDCDFEYRFNIYESYLQVVKRPNEANPKDIECSSTTSSVLLGALNQKIFYFQIYYDQMLFADAFGDKSIAFTRAKVDMRNYRIEGIFKHPSIA